MQIFTDSILIRYGETNSISTFLKVCLTIKSTVDETGCIILLLYSPKPVNVRKNRYPAERLTAPSENLPNHVPTQSSLLLAMSPCIPRLNKDRDEDCHGHDLTERPVIVQVVVARCFCHLPLQTPQPEDGPKLGNGNQWNHYQEEYVQVIAPLRCKIERAKRGQSHRQAYHDLPQN